VIGTELSAVDIPTTAWSDVLACENVMDIGIRPLWDSPRLCGPAYPVRCPPGENLMVHAAIYCAPPGSVLVIDGGDVHYAVAGGNVCAVAQRNGIAGFVIDGVIRDLGEIRAMKFPVFARGVRPIPGGKDELGTLGEPVTVGGVHVARGDLVVADEEGVVVVPAAVVEPRLSAATARVTKEQGQSLDEWDAAHRARVSAGLAARGYALPERD
jgi:regulator of RNase E activity RraA